MDNATILIVVIVAVIALLVIALLCLGSLLEGAAILLAWASLQGFIGVAVYFALWIFAFPFMLIVSIIIGLVSIWTLGKEGQKGKQIQAWRDKTSALKAPSKQHPLIQKSGANGRTVCRHTTSNRSRRLQGQKALR